MVFEKGHQINVGKKRPCSEETKMKISIALKGKTKTGGMENKRGMPQGHLIYPKKMILNKLTTDFKTTNDILKEINIETSMRGLSWNTVQKYLNLLKEEGLIETRKIGKYNLWRRDEMSKYGESRKVEATI